MDMLKQLSLAGLVPVIKVKNAEDAVPLCTALKNGGLPVAEITFRTDAAEEAIRLVHEALPDVLLGAGTVLTCEQADKAWQAGAGYIVSPGLNPVVVKHCIDKGYPVLPGCGNPSDIEAAISLGLKTVKFFPAEALGGLKLNVEMDVDAESYLPIRLYMDMAGSDWVTLGAMIGGMMGLTNEDGSLMSISLDVNDLYLEYLYDYSTPVTVEIPQEVIDSATDMGSAADLAGSAAEMVGEVESEF